MELGEAAVFVEYEQEIETLSIAEGLTTEEDIGEYFIDLTLVDSLGVKSEVFRMRLYVVEPTDGVETVQVEVVITNQNHQELRSKSVTGGMSITR